MASTFATAAAFLLAAIRVSSLPPAAVNDKQLAPLQPNAFSASRWSLGIVIPIPEGLTYELFFCAIVPHGSIRCTHKFG